MNPFILSFSDGTIFFLGLAMVLLLELPLFPFKNAYGKAQRDIAREYDCALLPKRGFTRVLGTPGGTTDGLHLSRTGHNAMAELIAAVLERRLE